MPVTLALLSTGSKDLCLRTYDAKDDGMIEFTVYGKAEPAGSKRAFVIKGRAIVTDANAKSRPWKSCVSDAAVTAYRGPLLTGPLAVVMQFYQVRPKGHYGSGKNAEQVKGSSPAQPTGKPDVLKLARGVEDALTGIIYRDDAQICIETIRKVYGSPARVEIAIKEL